MLPRIYGTTWCARPCSRLWGVSLFRGLPTRATKEKCTFGPQHMWGEDNTKLVPCDAGVSHLYQEWPLATLLSTSFVFQQDLWGLVRNCTFFFFSSFFLYFSWILPKALFSSLPAVLCTLAGNSLMLVVICWKVGGLNFSVWAVRRVRFKETHVLP